MRQQSTDTLEAYTAQSVSPPADRGPNSTGSDSASVGTPVTGLGNGGSVLDVEMTILDKQSKGVLIDE
jgi:hypothetical protein